MQRDKQGQSCHGCGLKRLREQQNERFDGLSKSLSPPVADGTHGTDRARFIPFNPTATSDPLDWLVPVAAQGDSGIPSWN